MTATDGEWVAPVLNAIPRETLRYGAMQMPDDRDLFVLHAVLLRTGKVLMFSGHAESMYYATVSFVLDPGTGTLTRKRFPGTMDLFCCHYAQLEDGRILVVGGSDPDFVGHGSMGARDIVLFDPGVGRTGAWRETGERLVQGRWYPTAVVLGDGRVLVFSGRREFRNPAGDPRINVAPSSIADWVEVLEPPRFKARHMTGADLRLPIYPGLHLAPDGRVYFTHTNWGQEIPNPTTRALSVTGSASGTWDDLGFRPARPRREEGMSVLLPLLEPDYEARILVVGGSEARSAPPGNIPVLQEVGGVFGGGPSGFHHIAAAADGSSAEILTTGTTPAWNPAPGGGTTQRPRINGHLVLLPDATVFVCGGHNNYKWLPNAATTVPNPAPPPADLAVAPTVPSLNAEIFTPGVGFREVAGAAPHPLPRRLTHPRMYHSVALLLPDGTVLVTGGADANDAEPVPAPAPARPDGYPPGWPTGDTGLRWNGLPLNRKEREIYRPPYDFRGPRPRITRISRRGASTNRVPYGSTFVVTTPEAAEITSVALMRPGAPTHHTDSEQRYVRLEFTRAGNNLTVTMVPDTEKGKSVAPPGYYMLWIVAGTGNDQRPCQRARFVHVPGPVRSRARGGAP